MRLWDVERHVRGIVIVVAHRVLEGLAGRDFDNKLLLKELPTLAQGFQSVALWGLLVSEVLTFAAEGALDKSTRWETDVHDSTDFIRGLLTPLRLGDG